MAGRGKRIKKRPVGGEGMLCCCIIIRERETIKPCPSILFSLSPLSLSAGEGDKGITFSPSIGHPFLCSLARADADLMWVIG
jgi:hypothetical protein